MTLEIGFLFLILAVMVALFLTEKIPVDLTAFLGLVVLVFTGFVTSDEAFTGFASSAVITMLAIFIVSASLLHTGIADMVGGRIHAWVGSHEIRLIVTIMLVSGTLSAFMNNIAAAAVLMPAVASLARRANLSPSRLFMPLSFGAILGGTTTLVGTPPNILVGAVMEERGMQPFELFDFTPLGVILLVLGIVFMVTIGRKLLPSREIGPSPTASDDLANVYQLDEMMFSIRIPEESNLHGATLEKARLGAALGVQVMAILRNGSKKLLPKPETVIKAGDVLLVEGQLSDLQQILKVQGVEIEKASVSQLPRPTRGFSAVCVGVADDTSFHRRSLKELNFRERYGAVVVAIKRGSRLLRDNLSEESLAQGDEVVLIGPREALNRLGEQSGFILLQTGLPAIRQLQEHFFMIKVDESSALAGTTLGASRIGELIGLTVGGIVRQDETLLGLSPDEVIRPGDHLLVVGEPEKIARLMDLGDIEFDPKVGASELESEDVALVEVSLAPRCSLIGRTLEQVAFRQRYGLHVLAVWREGAPIRARLAALKLTFGDALLVQGPREKIRLLAEDPDFVVLSQTMQVVRRTHRAPFAIGALLLMIGLVVAGIQPIHVAAFTAASLVVLAGALTMQEAYRSIEWRAIFLVAAILPVGVAMERTGAAPWLANTVVTTAGPLGPYVVLAMLVVLASLLSQGLDGAPTVVLLAPVVFEAASGLGLSPYPLMMGVALAASAAFMTPFSHKANLLVMGAGGYRAMDYVKVGTPLTILFLFLLVFMVPLFFPF